MTTIKWRKTDAKIIEKALAAGEPCQTCNCCGGSLPPYSAWETLRATGRGPECEGSVSRDGNCRAFAEIM